ncbi:MAG: fibrobacter succinogenes major paralogous domain-containing protein [Dysgonamonadaceae bacterium]|jgi:uncharacterized protein (TIGR02145 family)|nr:fibrobacter succinogenes major paralogous domain-containing protein [Dysgonamonadaceae bacterium]
MRKYFFILIALVILSATGAKAQVTIGSTVNPKSGALLDLNSTSKGGLLLSNVQITDLEKIPANTFIGIDEEQDENLDLTGMLVYNTADDAGNGIYPGVYFWNGYEWLRQYSGAEPPEEPGPPQAGSPQIFMEGSTVSYLVAVGKKIKWYNSETDGSQLSSTTELIDGATYYATQTVGGVESTLRTPVVVSFISNIPAGDASTGSLYGRACFDVATGNNGGNCREIIDRQEPSYKADFTEILTYQQTYTFATGTSDVFNVRFIVIDLAGLVASTSDKNPVPGSLAGGGVTTSLTVNFRNDINSVLQGRARSDAANVYIYAVYNTGSSDLQVSLKINMQDCACCGVKGNDNKWLEFMCHNLGATETADPFTPSYQLNGAHYQWGKKAAIAPAPTSANPGDEGVPSGWNAINSQTAGTFGKPKTSYDPCPNGYRVPTNDEWNQVSNETNNPRTVLNSGTYYSAWNENHNGFTNGIHFGKLFFLPAAGYRLNNVTINTTTYYGHLYQRNGRGRYWSTSSNMSFYFYRAGTSSHPTNISAPEGTPSAVSVRCIVQ